MPHVVQRCSSLGDSVGAGLSSPWLLFVAVRGCSWPCMAAWWHCLLPVMRCLAVAVRPLLAFTFLPCVPPSRRYAPAMISGRALCDSQLKGRFRQPWKTGIPESFLFSVYTAGNRFPWADVLFLCAVWYVCRLVVCAALRACRQRPKVFFVSSTRSSFSHVKSSTSTSRVG